MCKVGGLPLTHLFALHQSTAQDGILCKKSTRISTKDGAMLVTSLDDISPKDPEDVVTREQFPTSSELTRRGVILTLSDSPMWDYDIAQFTESELREMSVAMHRASVSDPQLMVSDTVEIRHFHEFAVKFQRTGL